MFNEPYAGVDNSIPRVRTDLHHFTGTDGQTKPRASITVHKSIANHCVINKELSNQDSVVLKISLDDKTIILASLYMDGAIDKFISNFTKSNYQLCESGESSTNNNGD